MMICRQQRRSANWRSLKRLLFPATWYAGTKTAAWFGGFNIASYYSGHFFLVSSIILLSGITLGAVASVLAIRKYLQV